jgi:predicted transport protein
MTVITDTLEVELPMAKSPHPTALFDVHPSVAYVQAVLANFKAKTGRTVDEWVALAQRQKLTDTKSLQMWLKTQGLGGTQASFVAQRAGASPGHAFDDSPEGYLAAAPGYVESQYDGKKAGLRPLFEHLLSHARTLGSDVRICPCETIVPFYRNRVFAEVKPFVSRLDLGLALGDPATVKDPSGRLKDTGGFTKKDRITHKVEIASMADLDAAVLGWLKQAYERDGN